MCAANSFFFNRKTVTLDVSETDTISVIKDKIADRENVPASQQRVSIQNFYL